MNCDNTFLGLRDEGMWKPLVFAWLECSLLYKAKSHTHCSACLGLWLHSPLARSLQKVACEEMQQSQAEKVLYPSVRGREQETESPSK